MFILITYIMKIYELVTLHLGSTLIRLLGYVGIESNNFSGLIIDVLVCSGTIRHISTIVLNLTEWRIFHLTRLVYLRVTSYIYHITNIVQKLRYWRDRYYLNLTHRKCDRSWGNIKMLTIFRSKGNSFISYCIQYFSFSWTMRNKYYHSKKN